MYLSPNITKQSRIYLKRRKRTLSISSSESDYNSAHETGIVEVYVRDQTNSARASEITLVPLAEPIKKLKTNVEYIPIDEDIIADSSSSDALSISSSDDYTEIQEIELREHTPSPIFTEYVIANDTPYVPIEEVKEQTDKNWQYLTAEGHVFVDRPSKDDLPVVSGNEYKPNTQVTEKPHTQDNVELCYVNRTTIKANSHKIDVWKKKVDYLTAHGHVALSVALDKDSHSNLSTTNSGNGSKPKTEKFSENQTAVTHVNPEKLPFISVYKDEIHTKTREYLTAHGHVNIDRNSKNELPITSSNSHPIISQRNTDQSTANTGKCRDTRPSQTRNIKTDASTARVHIIAPSGPKKNLVGDPDTENNKQTTENKPQQLASNELQFSSIYQEEIKKENRDYLVAHGHVSINHGLKDGLTMYSSKNSNANQEKPSQQSVSNSTEGSGRSESKLQPSSVKNHKKNRRTDYSKIRVHIIFGRNLTNDHTSATDTTSKIKTERKSQRLNVSYDDITHDVQSNEIIRLDDDPIEKQRSMFYKKLTSSELNNQDFESRLSQVNIKVTKNYL